MSLTCVTVPVNKLFTNENSSKHLIYTLMSSDSAPIKNLLTKWCEKNLSGPFDIVIQPMEYMVYVLFIEPEDAVKFKLAWV